MTSEQLVTCLAQTETNDSGVSEIGGKFYVRSGDGGQAIGRWQLHPDWMHTQEIRFGLQPKLNERHDDYQRRLVYAFVDCWNGRITDQEIAMYFHMGHRTRPTDADWDEGYAQRFQSFAANFAR